MVCGRSTVHRMHPTAVPAGIQRLMKVEGLIWISIILESRLQPDQACLAV